MLIILDVVDLFESKSHTVIPNPKSFLAIQEKSKFGLSHLFLVWIHVSWPHLISVIQYQHYSAWMVHKTVTFHCHILDVPDSESHPDVLLQSVGLINVITSSVALVGLVSGIDVMGFVSVENSKFVDGA